MEQNYVTVTVCISQWLHEGVPVCAHGSRRMSWKSSVTSLCSASSSAVNTQQHTARICCSAPQLLLLSAGACYRMCPAAGRGRLKMRDMNLRHQLARVENARHENAGPNSRGGKCGKS